MNLIEWPFYKSEFLSSQGFSKTMVSRFWTKVSITENCWIWKSSITLDGYGSMQWQFRRRPIGAHRVSWILHNGSIPEGLHVLHKCPDGSNPSCVNPSHLYLGTAKENAADRIREGRQRGGMPPGERCVISKLTWEKVIEIRKSTGLTQRRLALKFGVSHASIGSILRNETWVI